MNKNTNKFAKEISPCWRIVLRKICKKENSNILTYKVKNKKILSINKLGSVAMNSVENVLLLCILVVFWPNSVIQLQTHAQVESRCCSHKFTSDVCRTTVVQLFHHQTLQSYIKKCIFVRIGILQRKFVTFTQRCTFSSEFLSKTCDFINLVNFTTKIIDMLLNFIIDRPICDFRKA